MKYYYEINNCFIGKKGIEHKYYVSNSMRVMRIIQHSDRIWFEAGGMVKFIKHRGGNILLTNEEMEEFVFIKLRSQEIKHVI